MDSRKSHSRKVESCRGNRLDNNVPNSVITLSIYYSMHLAGRDDEPGGGVRRGVGELLVVARQLLQQLARLRVPDARLLVPT